LIGDERFNPISDQRLLPLFDRFIDSSKDRK
jgi:hypothetical protein